MPAILFKDLMKAINNGELKTVQEYIDEEQRNGSLSLTQLFDALGLAQVNKEIRQLINKYIFLLSAQNGNLSEVKRYLSDNKNTPEALRVTNLWGNSALILAAINGHKEIVDTLLAADDSMVNAANQFGDTPLHWAASNGYASIVKALVNKQADITLKNSGGKTALNRATELNNKEISTFLFTMDFLEMAKKGNIPNITGYIRAHKNTLDLRLQNREGETALILAVVSGNLYLVKALLEFDAGINLSDAMGDTALHWAAILEHTEIAQLLIDKGANLNSKNKTHLTPKNSAGNSDEMVALLTKAEFLQDAEKGNLEGVLQYLDTQKEIQEALKVTNSQGNTALMLAVNNGHFQVINKLLEVTNPSIDLGNNMGNTALHLAILKADQSTVQALLRKNANINLKNREGKTAITLAKEQTRSFILTLLLKISLERAIKNKDLRALEDWLNENRNNTLILNSINEEGKTALIEAVMLGNIPIVRTLLNGDMDIDAVDTEGKTALYWAAKLGHLEIAKALIEKKPRLKIRNAVLSAQNPAMIRLLAETGFLRAAEDGDLSIVQEYLEKNKDNPGALKATNPWGNTALLLAALNGHTQIVKALLDVDASSVNSTNQFGDSPLHWAVNNGHQAIVRLLLDNNANSDLVNQNGNTAKDLASKNNPYLLKLLSNAPLHIPAQKGDLMRVQQFITANKSHPKELEAKDEAGNNALMIAAARGHLAIVQALLDAGLSAAFKNNNNLSAEDQARQAGHTEIANLLKGAKRNIHVFIGVGPANLHRALKIQKIDPRAELIFIDNRLSEKERNINREEARANIFRFEIDEVTQKLLEDGVLLEDLKPLIDERDFYLDKGFQAGDDTVFSSKPFTQIQIRDLQLLLLKTIDRKAGVHSPTMIAQSIGTQHTKLFLELQIRQILRDHNIPLDGEKSLKIHVATGALHDREEYNEIIYLDKSQQPIFNASDDVAAMTVVPLHGTTTFFIQNRITTKEFQHDQRSLDLSPWEPALQNLGWNLLRPPRVRIFYANDILYVGAEIPASIMSISDRIEFETRLTEYTRTIAGLVFPNLDIQSLPVNTHLRSRFPTQRGEAGAVIQNLTYNPATELPTAIFTHGDSRYLPHYQTGSGFVTPFCKIRFMQRFTAEIPMLN